MTMTAEQKVRMQLTGSPEGVVQFQHEGPDVVRWFTGGNEPDAYVILVQEGNEKVARCPLCKLEFGRYEIGKETGELIGTIREAGYTHQPKEHPEIDWKNAYHGIAQHHA